MFQGISITCFAASYTVALALELSRLWFSSRVRGVVMLGFAGAGLFAHSLFLAHRAATAAATPLSSEFDWYLVAAWVLVALYLYLTYAHPRTAFGVFVLPIVLVLIAVGRFWGDTTPFATAEAITIWGRIHGFSLLLGYVTVMVGFVGGLMCLVQAWRMKHKRIATIGLRLPSLEWLERLNQRALLSSVVMFAIGLFSGIVLNSINRSRSLANIPWNDPIVWSSSLFAGWLIVAAGFSILYRPARQGRKVAYLTLVSFVFLALSIVVRFWLPSEHAGRKSDLTPHPSPLAPFASGTEANS